MLISVTRMQTRVPRAKPGPDEAGLVAHMDNLEFYFRNNGESLGCVKQLDLWCSIYEEWSKA